MRGSARSYRERLKLAVTGTLFLGIMGTGYVGGQSKHRAVIRRCLLRWRGLRSRPGVPIGNKNYLPVRLLLYVRNSIRGSRKVYRICLKMFQGYMYGR